MTKKELKNIRDQLAYIRIRTVTLKEIEPWKILVKIDTIFIHQGL